MQGNKQRKCTPYDQPAETSRILVSLEGKYVNVNLEKIISFKKAILVWDRSGWIGVQTLSCSFFCIFLYQPLMR